MTEDSRAEKKNNLYEQYPYAKRDVLAKLDSYKRYSGQKVLIAGCGVGERLFDIHHYGATVTAIDQSSEAIEFIRSQYDAFGREPPELITADLKTHEYKTDEYDFIISKGVLHHTTDEKRILSHFRDACKETGTIELLLYHSSSPVKYERKVIEALDQAIHIGRLVPDEIKRKLRWEDKYENPLWKTYTQSEAKTLCERAGLTVDRQWLSHSPLGRVSRAFLPEAVQYPLEKLLAKYRWHIRLHCSP